MGCGSWIPVAIPYRRKPVSRQKKNPPISPFLERGRKKQLRRKAVFSLLLKEGLRENYKLSILDY
jgi:hypothetical protein